MVTALLAVAVGSTILYSQRSTEPAPTGSKSGTGGSVLRIPAVLVVIFAFIFAGSGLGAVDVVVVAYTRELGIAGYSGLLLAVLALGSLLAGFVYGSVQWKSKDGVRLIVTLALLAVMSAGLPLSGNVFFVTATLFGIGISVAPTIIGGNAVVQAYARPEQLTEALAWISTALGIGISAGSAVAGQAVDAFDAHTAFLVVPGFSVVAMLTGFVGARPLLQRPEAS